MTYRTEIKVWSEIGHTPLTCRGGYYRDLLLDTECLCDDPASALAATKALINTTPGGASGHFSMPNHPNQNIRDGWTH